MKTIRCSQCKQTILVPDKPGKRPYNWCYECQVLRSTEIQEHLANMNQAFYRDEDEQ